MSEPRVLEFPKPTRFYLYYDRHNSLPGPDGYAFRLCVGGTYFHCRKIDLICPTTAIIQEPGKSPKGIIEGYTTRIEINKDNCCKVE